jgi:hypothetical protein
MKSNGNGSETETVVSTMDGIVSGGLHRVIRAAKVNVFLLLAIFFSLMSCLVFFMHLDWHWKLCLWLGSLLAGSVHFYFRRTKLQWKIERADLIALMVVVAVTAPVYLLDPVNVPYQVNPDEPQNMHVIERCFYQGLDPLALIPFFWWHPSMIYVAYGALSNLFFGTLEFGHFRIINAWIGFITCPIAYVFFRRVLPPSLACAACFLMVFSHSLIVLSRMLTQDNIHVLLEVTALMLLLIGYQRTCPSFSFLGGIVAGLGFYTKLHARVIIGLWLLFMLPQVVWRKLRTGSNAETKLLMSTVLAFVLTIVPIFLATVTNFDSATSYLKSRIMLFEEGRGEQQRQIGKGYSEEQAIRENVLTGLTAFNSKKDDGWGLYFNPAVGFVDPITGILIWTGVFAVAYEAWRGTRRRAEDILFVGSFFALWLIFSFITNIAPVYGRLLMTLPFVAYLVIRGLDMVVRALIKPFKENLPAGTDPDSSRLPLVAFSAFLIAFLNFGIFMQYLPTGNQDERSNIRRYLRDRQDRKQYYFYVVSGPNDPFIDYRVLSSQKKIEDFFQPSCADGQLFTCLWMEHGVDVDTRDGGAALISRLEARPFSVFMWRRTWDAVKPAFSARFPNFTVHQIRGRPERLVVEVE